jgi:hypothetical protein
MWGKQGGPRRDPIFPLAVVVVRRREMVVEGGAHWCASRREGRREWGGEFGRSLRGSRALL